MTSFSLLLLVIFLTLAFEFSNGWHDAANSIATVVSTRVLTPFRAVLWAAFWNSNRNSSGHPPRDSRRQPLSADQRKTANKVGSLSMDRWDPPSTIGSLGE